ncbi:Component of the cap-binding complex (CBC) [Globomyces sp. JEL0801]|nr:Component of the cap-binding complex (CBC) [Globomyces sp. JEL0801]
MGDYNRRNNNNSYRKKRNYNDFQDDYKPLKSPDEETVDRITNSLFRLGEKRDFKLDVEDAVVSIEKDYQLNKDLCLTAIKGCLYQVPYKISIFASLTGLLNAKNFDLGADIIQIAAQLLNEGLDLCQFRKVKLMVQKKFVLNTQVRFFSECVNANVILPGQLITLYDNLLSVANEVGASQERTDAFAFIVMASIPWASATLKERSVGELERLLNDLETYMSSRDMNSETVGIALANEALSVYRDCGPEEPYQKFDTPLLLNIAHIFKDGFERQIQHEIPQIIIPTSITIVKFLYQPKFLIFDDKVNVAGEKKICNLPSTSDISRFMLDDCITDTIRIFSLNHKECAELLLSTQHYFNTDYIESQGYQVYESVVETIFAELFRFPKTHEKAVYYTTLIIDLCKESLDKIPSVLGRCIKLLFSRLDSAANPIGGMDVECIKRFSDFFAQHLSNFGFSWKWNEWYLIENNNREFVLDENTSSGQFVFIRETLQKCVRLAYYDRIKNSIPESFETHGKIFPTSAPSFHFKFQDATIVGDEILTEMVSHGLNGKISGREDVAVVENALEGIHQYLSNNNSILSNPEFENTISRVTHEALIQCIMFQGSKSFSHLLNVIERYLSLLQKMNEEAENRLLTIKVISSFWQNNFQFLEIILGKLLNYRVVDPKSILTWLLSSEILEVYYDHFFLWTILSSTLSKINLKAEQISAKLQTISADPNAENAMHDDSMDNIHSLNVALEASHREKKETKFVQVLSEKLEQDSDAVNTPFWRWFQTDVDQLKFTLEAVVFTNDVDESILSIWKQAIQVYNLHGEDIA